MAVSSISPASFRIQTVPNLRDLGSHMTQSGGRVRSGLLYRSEHLGRVSGPDRQALASLGLKTIFDLRTAEEIVENPDQLPAGAQHIVIDVLADEQQAAPAELLHLLSNPREANDRFGGGKIDELFTAGYRAFVTLPSARAGYNRLLTALADAENLPALFHCTTGKDRTGWAAAALLTFCGVSTADVLDDYLLSNDYILPEYQALITQFTAAGVEKEILLSILGVRQEYIQAAFTEMQDQFGDIEGYFNIGLGIDSARRQALRDRFVEPG